MTASRLPIKDNVIDCLRKLKTKYDIASIGGSDYVKAKEQLASAFNIFKYVFTENGLVSFKEGEQFHTKRLSDFLGEDKLKEMINYCLEYIAKVDIPIKRGTFIEYRTGMINVSPIGRNCSYQERLDFSEYNKTHKVIEKFRDDVSSKFGSFGMKFSIGGQISFDCYPIGWDKTYCLQFLKDYDNVFFFGDKTAEGGNDHELSIHPLIKKSFTVKGPEDTIQQINALVKEFDSLN